MEITGVSNPQVLLTLNLILLESRRFLLCADEHTVIFYEEIYT